MDRLGGTFGSYDHADDHEDYDDSDHGDDLGAPQSPVGQDERRMQVRAYNHWASLLDDRNFPAIDDLDPENLGDFGAYSVLLDFRNGIENPRVRFLGEELASECDAVGPVARLSDVPSRSLLSRITDHYLQILANQAPIGFEAEFVNQRDQTVLYRGILLPYSSDDVTIDFIFGVINWKELADQETADELLLEIDQALGQNDGAAPADDAVLDLAGEWVDEQDDADDRTGDEIDTSSVGIDWDAADSPLRRRGEGQVRKYHDFDDEDEIQPDYAVDYGEQGLEDETDDEDVDEVVDPLADENIGAGLSALVSRGQRRRPLLDLSLHDSQQEPDRDSTPAVPEEYESDAPEPEFVRTPITFQVDDKDEDAAPEIDPGPDARFDEAEAIEDVEALDLAEGLYDTLADARELAQAARTSEDRTRAALYQAVGRAYDVSLEAEKDKDGFSELLADSGLTVQARAPMTPVIKLVFGSDYDKTRVTEYAAVLSHAHRLGLAAGSLADFLRNAAGGLKGVVEAERQARREDAGTPARTRKTIRPTLARKLRKLAPVAIADLVEDGPEFALVVVRRESDGGVTVLGEVPEEVRLVERAARRLVA
ncbi:hypothetical protein [Qipengyuania sp. MTN3-11]|uniref:PAS domain-containing protein n=1 Tax=Qipengyuania sp. MTN3-11 TaxID=3056557 RepID=UPI0036F35BF6